MLGELYLQYYDKERWSIDRRTAISGYLPEDMKEWSKNNLFDKAVEHLNASIDQQKKLEETEVKSYEPLVAVSYTHLTSHVSSIHVPCSRLQRC